MKNKKLTVKQFCKKYNGVPWELKEIAYVISDEVEECKLLTIANKFIEADDDFNTELEVIGYEFG